ncbi:putative nuclear RNA export factor SDE5 isoform X2 [Euphorbia lathyris]|uniref:putative nuclear RNA export factor SDE5 isoform X2 n=1 Tax=Euphorbia lathyris TaxID=212925 RepID=UPI0033135673
MSMRYDDNNEKALKGLLGAFGSTFSIQDITSAYHKADKKADLAGEILEMQGRGSTSSEFASHRKPIFVESSRSYDNVFEKSRHPNGKARAQKQKWRPISGGTVSSVLGKDYIKPVPIANGCMGTKPTKLDTKELPASVLWGEETGLNPSKNGQLQKETEDFVFRMLGGGFQLEEHLIQQIIGSHAILYIYNCGYDVQKSMGKLLDMPALNMDEGDKRLSKSTEKTLEVHPNSEHPSLQNSFPPMSSNGGGANLNGDGVIQQEKRNDLQKEVLVALFNGADKSKVSRRKEIPKRRSRALGTLVVEPPRDIALEPKAASVVLNQDKNDDEDEEDAYEQLRRAVKEYRATMKEYYKAAVVALAKGDHDRSKRLMDEGHFFHEKAQEADKESSQKIFETKNVDTQDELILDLHEYGAKDAIPVLKCHISSLSGIASIKYLNVIIETDEKDTSKGARRRLIMKLLEKESIKWSEGGDAGTIVIRVDNINRKALSFAKI